MNRRLLLIPLAVAAFVRADGPFVRRGTWFETLRATRPALRLLASPRSAEEKGVWDAFWQRLATEFSDATAEGLSRSLPPPVSPQSPGTSFHVALNGDDANPGTAARPFRTLERARDAIRAGDRTKPITVWVHGGIHYLERPLRLEIQDSGTAAPITYRAAPGEKVILSGGRPITGWQQGKDGIWYTDLPDARDPRFGRAPKPRVIRYNSKQVSYTGTW
ncbi:MAG: hypothetical protein HN904_16720, partial [Victivallales bacterium]|nr:hypothetical protein [Victivallales bacterium]